MPVPVRLLSAVAVALVPVFPVALHAATLRVPSEYPTIQSALDASSPGDDVLVAPGTYAARFTKTLTGPPITGLPNPVTALAFIPSGVALRSEAGATETILDGVDGTVRGVIIHGGKARDAAAAKSLPDGNVLPTPGPAVLEGFTLVNLTKAIVVGNVRFALLDNVVNASIDIYEATTAGIIQGNAINGTSSVFCYTTSTDGTTWQENDFKAGGGLICRCNQSVWTGNTFCRGLSVWPFVNQASATVVANTFIGAGIGGTVGNFLIAENTMDGLGGGTGILVFGAGARGIIDNNSITAYTDGLTIADLEVSNNVIERCRDGIDGLGNGAFVHHNQILDALNWGIVAGGGTGATIEDNDILRSGTDGIFVGCCGSGNIRRNRVLYSGRHGIIQVYGILEENIVAFSGGDGMRVGAGVPNGLTGFLGPIVRSNTIVANTGLGLNIGSVSSDNSIDHNIVAFNGSYGVRCLSGGAPTNLACNDSYGNAADDFASLCADAAGNGGNISLDPLVCDLLSGDLGLLASSPCAPENSGGCDLIGALPVGCMGKTSELVREAATAHSTWGRIKARFR